MKIQITEIAKIVHQANKAYCEALGDNSQVDWQFAPENIKQSAIDGVRFKIIYPYSSAKDQHENWYKFKEADGWVYGEVKDMEKKTHPCMVPYDQLPIEQQVKDTLFKSIVLSFINPSITVVGL